MNNLKQAIEYIKNAGGNATLASLFNDAEPIGPWLWAELCERDLAKVEDDKIVLTAKGVNLSAEYAKGK